MERNYFIRLFLFLVTIISGVWFVLGSSVFSILIGFGYMVVVSLMVGDLFIPKINLEQGEDLV